jgi:hypothetical protein
MDLIPMVLLIYVQTGFVTKRKIFIAGALLEKKGDKIAQIPKYLWCLFDECDKILPFCSRDSCLQTIKI